MISQMTPLAYLKTCGTRFVSQNLQHMSKIEFYKLIINVFNNK